jgi:hypothetical protein
LSYVYAAKTVTLGTFFNIRLAFRTAT